MITIRITGVDETLRKLHTLASREKIADLIADATQTAHEAMVEGAAKHHAEGTMERNVTLRVSRAALEGKAWIEDRGMMVSWKGRRINYAAFVLLGTRPHPIVPVKRKALRWQKGGLYRFAKSVRHPGYRGDDFIARAAEKTLDYLKTHAQRILDD